jgi:hypothetical protein
VALLASVLLPVAATAQLVVDGLLVDQETGAPLAGVVVRATSEGTSVTTDSAGGFRLEVPAGRPGVTLSIDLPGYASLTRTWILPLDRPITIGMTRAVTAAAGVPVPIDDAVVDRLKDRLERIEGGRTWVADEDELRAHVRQQSEVLRILVSPLAAFDIPCGACAVLDGGIGARLTVDEERVDVQAFRAVRVAEVCRVEVVRMPTPPHPNIRIVGGASGIHVYTCGFLGAVSAGDRALAVELEPWFSWGSRGVER